MYRYNPYGKHYAHPYDAWKAWLISKELGGAEKIIDIGCGDGWLSASLPGTVIGVDIDDEALASAKKKIFAVKADLQRELPFADNFFDAGIASEILEHLVELDRALSEMNRILKIGGYYIITTPNIGFIGKRMRLLLGEFELHPPQSRFFPHVRFFTLRSLDFLLKDYGFRITNVYTRRPWQKLCPSLFCSELIVKAAKERNL